MLAAILTGGNRNDVTQFLPVLDAVPPVRGRVGRPRRRAVTLYADRGYDHDRYRKQVRTRGIVPAIARCDTEHGSGLGVYRWVVERTFAWLHGFRRLRVRWERRAGIHEAVPRTRLLPDRPPTTELIVSAVVSRGGSAQRTPWRRFTCSQTPVSHGPASRRNAS